MMEDVATHSSTLVGRDNELTELLSWVADDRDSPPKAVTGVLLSGDAGVGKTRLLGEARERLAGDGWQVVVGHCLDLGDTALPYLPFSEVLQQLAAELPETVAGVAGAHPALARLQPGRRMLGTDGDASSVDRTDLFEAVHALL